MNSQAMLMARAGWMAGIPGVASGRRHSISAARAMNPSSTTSVMAGGSVCRNEPEISW
jgi:hypothetical protein